MQEIRSIDGRLVDVTGARNFWRRRLGATAGTHEDLVDALASAFVNRIVIEDPAAFDAIRGRPAIFVANHQVAIESLLLAGLVAGLHERILVALAKAEHRDSWLGRLARSIASVSGDTDPENLVFFDRADAASLLTIVNGLRARLTASDASILVHVEGTRARVANAPVQRMSSIWVDLALASDAVVVPVRFTRGLPLNEVATSLEFPIGYWKQDYYIGRPIRPEELRPLNLIERQRRVLGAINALGARVEVPSQPDSAIADAVARCVHQGKTTEECVLRVVVDRLGRG
jgi:1-acyl-sn-glycerol-3-phosphate acyltransferase